MARLRSAFACTVLLFSSPALASDKFREIETKYLFGFTNGTDIGAEGEKELEVEYTGAYQMRAGRYAAHEIEYAFEHVPSQYWGYEFNVHMNSHQIAGVPGMDDRSYTNFSGLSWKPKWLILGRGPGNPFGLSLSVEPEWEKVDGGSGIHSRNFSSTVKLAVDTEVIPNRLYAATNLIYEPEWARENGDSGWAHESGFGATAALAYRLTPMIALGGEAEYYRAYRGLGFNGFDGHALYLGPTLYVQLTPKVFLAGAWSAEVAGQAHGDLARLDLDNFQRHRVNLKMGVEF